MKGSKDASSIRSPLESLRSTPLTHSSSSTDALGSNLSEENSRKAALRNVLAQLDRKLLAERTHKKPIETQVVHTFRKYAITEKERLQQKKQALKKKEKDKRIAELIEFSKTFKLPPSLAPKDKTDTTASTSAEASSSADKEKNQATPNEAEPAKEEVTTEKAPEKNEQAEASTTEKEPDSSDAAAKPTKDEKVPESESTPAETTTTETTAKETKAETSDEPKTETKDTDKEKEADKKQTTTSAPKSTPGITSKLNANATEFRPNPAAAPFVPSIKKVFHPDAHVYNPFFGDRQLKKDKLSVREVFFKSTKATRSADETSATEENASQPPEMTPPVWEYGDKPFRQQYQVHSTLDSEDGESYPAMMAPALPPPGPHEYPYQMAPYYRYPHPQFMPPMPMQPGPMPYLTQAFAPPVAFSPPVAHGVPPPNAGPAMYGSPQMPAAVIRPVQTFHSNVSTPTSAAVAAGAQTSPEQTQQVYSSTMTPPTSVPLQPSFSPALGPRPAMMQMPSVYAYPAPHGKSRYR
jgi:chemotaxis protein histidine kinase CheA